MEKIFLYMAAMVIFERDFVNQDEKMTIEDYGDFEIVKETKNNFKVNSKLSVSYPDNSYGFVEVSDVVYKKEWLNSILDNSLYQDDIKEISEEIYQDYKENS